ncbi:MAG: hypothetical protein ACI956_002442, partial [Nonlabens sp.]
DQLAPNQISRVQFIFEEEEFVFHYEAKKRKECVTNSLLLAAASS